MYSDTLNQEFMETPLKNYLYHGIPYLGAYDVHVGADLQHPVA